MSGYAVKDSGKRQAFDSGMVRDVTEGKTDYSLAFDGPMFERWAVHITKGADKYAKRNWMRAQGEAEYLRFRESACRHFLQWLKGDTDEDHAAAVFFNVNGAEYVKALSVQDSRSFIGNEQAVPNVGRIEPEPGMGAEPEPVGQLGYVIPEEAKIRA